MTTSYPRSIPPGEEGSISINLDTHNRGGQSLLKKVVVKTNDPQKQIITLTLSGTVDVFATIKPKIVKLIGPAGDKIERSIEIIPGDNNPFHILDYEIKKGENIRCKITEKYTDEKVSYVLTVENLKMEKGRFFDAIYLKTDHPKRSKLKVAVFGIIS